MCVCVCVCVCARADTHTHTHTQTYTLTLTVLETPTTPVIFLVSFAMILNSGGFCHDPSYVFQKSVCFPMALIPGFAKTCNLTSSNGGRSWFCAHPASKGLNCSHWQIFTNMEFIPINSLPISPAFGPFLAKLKK